MYAKSTLIKREELFKLFGGKKIFQRVIFEKVQTATMNLAGLKDLRGLPSYFSLENNQSINPGSENVESQLL
jgi:hypothetical protein